MHIDEDAMKRKAMELPVQGVPPELITLLPNDGAYDKLHIQKAATPVEAMKNGLVEAAASCQNIRPNAVVLENSCLEVGDLKIRRETGIRNLAEMLTPFSDQTRTPTDMPKSFGPTRNSKAGKAVTQTIRDEERAEEVVGRLLETLTTHGILHLSVTLLKREDLGAFTCTSLHAGDHVASRPPARDYISALRQRLVDVFKRGDTSSQRFVMTTGTAMQPQFKPWYFGVAFAFLFKYGVGMPDMPEWSKDPRHRRSGDAPRVDLQMWVKLMTRRVEQQLKRDWLFGFTMFSVLYRSFLNQCKTVYSYDVRREDGSNGFTAEELEPGAISICQGLDGKYIDMNGKVKKVNGDFAKVKYASNLNEAGRRLLKNLEHTTRQIKGTMEVRKMMRYETNAGRVRRGVPIFVTWSPDEKNNVLILRLHRSRRNDPIHELDKENKKFGARAMPNMDQDFVEMKVFNLFVRRTPHRRSVPPPLCFCFIPSPPLSVPPPYR